MWRGWLTCKVIFFLLFFFFKVYMNKIISLNNLSHHCCGWSLPIFVLLTPLSLGLLEYLNYYTGNLHQIFNNIHQKKKFKNINSYRFDMAYVHIQSDRKGTVRVIVAVWHDRGCKTGKQEPSSKSQTTKANT